MRKVAIVTDSIVCLPGEAEGLKEQITSEFECTEIYVRDFTPVMGIHTGPGLPGIAFYAEG